VLPVEIPVFPLKVVLFPGGQLSLRIFEQRYIDMVTNCMRNDAGFGVVLVIDSGIPEQPAWHSRIGTLAKIRDFFTHEDGLLGITIEGTDRFRIHHTKARHDGLMVAETEWLVPEPVQPVPEIYSLLVEITRKFSEVAANEYPALNTPHLDDASWVGFRLAELLPLENVERQRLLECGDPMERLQALLEAVPPIQPE
jgi:Lon protease-like protein